MEHHPNKAACDAAARLQIKVTGLRTGQESDQISTQIKMTGLMTGQESDQISTQIKMTGLMTGQDSDQISTQIKMIMTGHDWYTATEPTEPRPYTFFPHSLPHPLPDE
jgi:hypothetical protein